MSQSYESAPQAPPGPPPGGPSGPRAGFRARLGAAILDGLIIGIPGAIVIGIAGAISDALLILAYLVYIVVGIGYYIYFEGGPTGQTIGKKVLNIRVMDINQGGPIGYGRAAIRYVVRIVSAIPIYLGYLWMLWDSEKQTWHDKAASCVVVPADAYR